MRELKKQEDKYKKQEIRISEGGNSTNNNINVVLEAGDNNVAIKQPEENETKTTMVDRTENTLGTTTATTIRIGRREE